MFPYLAAFDDRIDELQDGSSPSRPRDKLAALFDLKRKLVELRKVVTPQRDMMGSMLSRVIASTG